MSAVVIGVLGALVLSAAYSGFETGYYVMNQVRLRYRVEAGVPGAATLASVLRDPRMFIFTTLVGNNLAHYLASSMVTNYYLETGIGGRGLTFALGVLPWSAEVAATMTLTLPIFLFAEVGPKNLFRMRANTLMYQTARVLRLSYLLFLPITWPLRLLASALPRHGEADVGEELVVMSRRRLHVYFSEGATEGILTAQQSDMAANVMALRHTPVREVMRPLAVAPCLPASATVADFQRLARQRQANRALLYTHSRRRIVGGVHMFDLMAPEVTVDRQVGDFVRPVVEIAATATLQTAIYELRRARQSMAVVVDSRGNAVGQLLIETITERLVSAAEG